MAGTLVIDTLTDGSGNSTSATAVVRGCAKAWVKFTGSTGGVNSSYNVSSVTRSAAGVYTVNFTNALADANFGWALGATRGAGVDVNFLLGSTGQSTTTINVVCTYAYSSPGTYYDPVNMCVAIFR